MSGLSGRNIILGVTGSIAAYKAAVLAREIVRRGAHLRVTLTGAASHFISPLTFASISRYPVATQLFPQAGSEPESGSWHIDWALWADAMIVAPTSATTIAKLANGLCDNPLTVIATALRGRLLVAPAMDVDMYHYPPLQKNLETLRAFGVVVIPPGEGELASGLHGLGRLAETEQLIDALDGALRRRDSLAGRRVLVTAGPTHEPIDPVRYIANHSSGKMGYALAAEARDRGAAVTLVTGPTSLLVPAGIEVRRVTTAAEMAAAVEESRAEADLVIAAAAVADFTPERVSDQKMKRREMSETPSIRLIPTRDILKSVGERKRSGQIVVGFALETRDLLESARAKLYEKHCDLVVSNGANEDGAGFGSETNRITLVYPGSEQALPLMSKRECATAILDAVEELIASAEPRRVSHG